MNGKFSLPEIFSGRYAALLCGVIILGHLAGTSTPVAAAQGAIRVASEKAYVDLLSLWAESSGIKVNVQVVEARQAIRLAGGGQVDFALVGGTVSEGDRAILGARPGRLPLVKEVGCEALALVVHPDNPLPFILEQEARCIFCATGCSDASPTLSVWNQLTAWAADSATASIRAILPGSNTETGLGLVHLLDASCSSIPERAGSWSDADIEREVAQDTHAIGIVYRLRSIQKARVVPVKGKATDNPVLPEPGKISSGEYPLSGKISLLYNLRSRPESPQSRFLSFISTPKAHEDLRKAGFYPMR